MKIKINRLFRYMDGTKLKELAPGVHDLSKDLAEKVLRWGKAEILVQKKAPENKKRDKAPENKVGVASKSVHRRSTRAKPDK